MLSLSADRTSLTLVQAWSHPSTKRSRSAARTRSSSSRLSVCTACPRFLNTSLHRICPRLRMCWLRMHFWPPSRRPLGVRRRGHQVLAAKAARHGGNRDRRLGTRRFCVLWSSALAVAISRPRALVHSELTLQRRSVIQTSSLATVSRCSLTPPRRNKVTPAQIANDTHGSSVVWVSARTGRPSGHFLPNPPPNIKPSV